MLDCSLCFHGFIYPKEDEPDYFYFTSLYTISLVYCHVKTPRILFGDYLLMTRFNFSIYLTVSLISLQTS